MAEKNEITKREREFSRVNARVPMDVRPVPPGEQEKVGARIFGHATPDIPETVSELESGPLSDWLRVISQKLDIMINLLSYQEERYTNLPFREVNISGGGLSFDSAETYMPGSVLEIKLVLSQFPPLILYLYGEVVRMEGGDRDSRVAVKFVSIDETVREEIIRFVFKKQREILRQKREKGEGS